MSNPVRVALLGSTTTEFIGRCLCDQLTSEMMTASDYHADYGRWFQESLFPSQAFHDFQPNVIYLHCPNLWERVPTHSNPEAACEELLESLVVAWQSLRTHFPEALIIQENFPDLGLRPFGFSNRGPIWGHARALARLNERLLEVADKKGNTLVHDASSICTRLGASHYFDSRRYFLFKVFESDFATSVLSHSLARLIVSHYRGPKKLLLVDLDNTLWGGEIGEIGVEGIELGPDTPTGEAFAAFQSYLRYLSKHGVVLGAVSKNDPQTALQGLTHPHSILHREDFAVFKAGWQPKADYIKEACTELRLSPDSCVFIDDSTFERAEVRARLPMVAVPELGEVEEFVSRLDELNYFGGSSATTAEDLGRTELYRMEGLRQAEVGKHATYMDFLKSLNARVKIEEVTEQNLTRVHQLVQKTNQFNMNGKRLSEQQILEILSKPGSWGVQAELSDKFGNAGKVSAVIMELTDRVYKVRSWVMSCRVLQRGLEWALLRVMLSICRERGVALQLENVDTSKNGRFREFLSAIPGFDPELDRFCLSYDTEITDYPIIVDHPESVVSNHESVCP